MSTKDINSCSFVESTSWLILAAESCLLGMFYLGLNNRCISVIFQFASWPTQGSIPIKYTRHRWWSHLHSAYPFLPLVTKAVPFLLHTWTSWIHIQCMMHYLQQPYISVCIQANTSRFAWKNPTSSIFTFIPGKDPTLRNRVGSLSSSRMLIVSPLITPSHHLTLSKGSYVCRIYY